MGGLVKRLRDARGGGYALFLTGAEAVLALGKHDAGGAGRAAVRTKLVGANEPSEVEGVEPLPGKSNYFIGNDPSKWRTGVPHYAKVRYASVYDGVDLVYYGNQRQLEYDFRVAPGADPSRVRMSFEGVEEVVVDDAGELVLKFAGGELRQRRPVVYRESEGVRREVAGRYVLGGDARSVGFEVGDYDAGAPLVIDPVLVYSTYLGGSLSDSARAVAVDSSGSAYVVGDTGSTDFPTLSQFQTDQPGQDAFVSKISIATLVVNSNDDANDGSCDAAHCSLREAINAANADPGLNTIEFNISGAGVRTITPLSALPAITDPVVINGYTQPGATQNTLPFGSNAAPLIQLNGASAGDAHGLHITTGGGSVVRGLVINGFARRGIEVGPGGGNTIDGCFIGTNASGTAAVPNVEGSIIFVGSPNNRVGGTTDAARNVISGNTGQGVDIFLNSNNTTVEGNLTGTNATGTSPVPNGAHGVLIRDSSNNTVGGTSAGARNVISANDLNGVLTLSNNGFPATGNQILGNFIGTGATGTTDLGNAQSGVRLDASSNTVGGTGRARATSSPSTARAWPWRAAQTTQSSRTSFTRTTASA